MQKCMVLLTGQPGTAFWKRHQLAEMEGACQAERHRPGSWEPFSREPSGLGKEKPSTRPPACQLLAMVKSQSPEMNPCKLPQALGTGSRGDSLQGH